MTDKQKIFIKQNSIMLSEIYGEKISRMMIEVLDNPDQKIREKKIDAINELRDWLREIDMIEKGKELKPTTFI